MWRVQSRRSPARKSSSSESKGAQFEAPIDRVKTSIVVPKASVPAPGSNLGPALMQVHTGTGEAVTKEGRTLASTARWLGLVALRRRATPTTAPPPDVCTGHDLYGTVGLGWTGPRTDQSSSGVYAKSWLLRGRFNFKRSNCGRARGWIDRSRWRAGGVARARYVLAAGAREPVHIDHPTAARRLVVVSVRLFAFFGPPHPFIRSEHFLLSAASGPMSITGLAQACSFVSCTIPSTHDGWGAQDAFKPRSAMRLTDWTHTRADGRTDRRTPWQP